MYKNRLNIVLALFSLLFAGLSCVKEPVVTNEGMSQVVFELLQVETKAEAAPMPVDSFKVEILNATHQVIKRWRTYAECKSEPIYLNAGNYFVRAACGDSTLTGWNVRSYAGETAFTLAPQAVETSVKVVCRPSNVKVGVAFGPHITADYKEVFADVYNIKSSKSRLRYTPDSTDEGYFPAGNLVLSLETTDYEGTKGYFKDYSVIAKAGEKINYRIDTQELPAGSSIFEIQIQSETIDTTITIDLMSAWVAPTTPTIKFVGEDGQNLIEGTQAQQARIEASAQAGFNSCILKIEKSAPLKALGIADETELLGTNPYTALGLRLTKTKTLLSVSFEELMSTLGAINGDNETKLTLIATDGKNRTVSQSVSFTLEAPVFSIAAPEAGNVYTKKATTTYSVTKGNPDLFTPQLSLNGTDWFTPQYTADGNNVTFSSLTPGTSYALRAKYQAHTTTPSTFVTETPATLPNSGFEEFSVKSFNYKAWTSSYTRYEYYPWNDGASDAQKHWATNNSETCIQPGTPAYQNGKQFPSVNYTTSSHSGGKAAELRNVTIGSGANAVGIGATGIVHTCGKLYLATFSGGNASEGYAFGSRPTKLEFYYKYAPLGNDTAIATIELYSGATKIASGEWSCTQSVGSWTKAVVDLNYTNTTLKATGIRLKFQSSNQNEPPYEKRDVVINGTTYETTYTGSVLDVDDLDLIYEN